MAEFGTVVGGNTDGDSMSSDMNKQLLCCTAQWNVQSNKEPTNIQHDSTSENKVRSQRHSSYRRTT